MLATKQYKPSIVHRKVLETITCKHKLSVLSDKTSGLVKYGQYVQLYQ